MTETIWPKRELVGTLRTRKSLEIESSCLSIGFEALDRRLFEPQKTYAHLADLGVKWARVQTGWCRCEKEKGRYDFVWLDEVVNELRRIGIQPWFNVGYGNKLYTPDATHEFAVGWVPMGSDEARAAWLRFVGALVDHFKDRVTHLEIWNEPNLKFYWQPNGPEPAQYAEFVRLTAAEIRRRHPKAVIIGGGLSGGLMPRGLEFAEKVLEAGLAESIDCFSVHAYERMPEAAAAAGNIAKLRTMLDRRKPGISIWQGEGGCPSRSDGFGAMSNLNWDEAKQARWLVRRVVSDVAAGLPMVSYFTTADLKSYPGRGVKEKFAYFGLLRGEDYTPKPSYAAYQSLCTLFDDNTRRAEDVPVQLTSIRGAGGAPLDANRLAGARSCGFRRDNRALVAYWLPTEDASREEPALSLCDLNITLAAGVRLDRPVLVDPLTQRVYRAEIQAIPAQGPHRLFIRDLPLLDYPLLITDRAALP